MTLSANFDRDLLIIDTEGTGVEDYHVICQWGSILLDRHTLEEKSRLDTLIRIRIGDAARANPGAMDVHGIPVEDLMSDRALPFNDLVKLIETTHGPASDYYVYGVNVQYDINMFKRMCGKYRIDFPFNGSQPVGCRIYDLQSHWALTSATLGLGWGGAALRQMAKKFNIPAPEKHGAISDCEITAEVERNVIRILQPDNHVAIPAPDCKDCGFRMQLRANFKTGAKFFGCSNFPECRKTQRIK